MSGVAEYWYSLVLSGFVRFCDGKAEYCRILSCGGEAGCGIVMCSVGNVHYVRLDGAQYCNGSVGYDAV